MRKLTFNQTCTLYNSELKPISKRIIKQAYNKSFPKEGYKSRSTWYCLECGESFKDNNAFVKSKYHKCPKCNTKLVQKENHYRHNQYAYFMYIDTYKEFQVLRMYMLIKFTYKGKAAEYFSSEVMQYFINDKGKMCCLQKQCFTYMSAQYDRWDYRSELKIRQKSHYWTLRYNIWPECVHINNILPIINRNGFDKDFHGFRPQELFNTILSDNKMEILWKMKQYKLFNYYLGYNRRDIDKHWQQIMTCIKNDYIVNDVPSWIDYINLLKHFNKDIMNSHYVCPSDFKAAHVKYVKLRRKEIQLENLQKQKEDIKKHQKKYSRQKRKFMKLHFEKDDIVIEPLKSVEEFLIEGDELNHCVFTNEYFLKKDSLILSAKVNNQRTETIEISLKDMKIMQSRGIYNKKSEYHETIMTFMNQCLPQIKPLIKAS